MNPELLSPSEAARRLRISPKALRLYEKRGLVAPIRTAAGWRVYGPGEMARAGQVAALRALGFSLSQAARVLQGDMAGLEQALAAHETVLDGRRRQLTDILEKVRRLRGNLANGEALSVDELTRLAAPARAVIVAFDLPWPWGGERFELRDVRLLNYITGPLGSGKTRLARRLAEVLPGASFLGLERLESSCAPARGTIEDSRALKARVEETVAWLVEDGATPSDALLALVKGLEQDTGALIVDMIEQGLDEATQQALVARLRRRGPDGRPLFALTRSSAILDLAAGGDDETIIYCPANHSPPIRVEPYPDAPGYEAVASCLASPAVRARTEDVIASRPGA